VACPGLARAQALALLLPSPDPKQRSADLRPPAEPALAAPVAAGPAPPVAAGVAEAVAIKPLAGYRRPAYHGRTSLPKATSWNTSPVFLFVQSLSITAVSVGNRAPFQTYHSNAARAPVAPTPAVAAVMTVVW